MLTNLAIRQAVNRDKPYKMYDGEGLFLYITKSSKKWRMRYRLYGKEKLLTFGDFPKVSLSEARKRRDEIRSVLNSGEDPSLVRKKEKLKSRYKSDSFREIASLWLKAHRARVTDKHANLIKRAMERTIIPHVGGVSIGEITPPMILSVLKDVEKTSVDKAHRIRMWTSAVFRYAIALGFCEFDPASQLQVALKPKRKGRQPAITDLADFKKMLFVVDKSPSNFILKKAFQFMALTALRSGEIRSISWDDIHGDVLLVPAHKMKMNIEHTVPLSHQALATLKKVQPFTFDADYIFPSPIFKHRQMSDMTLSEILRRSGYRGLHVPHGNRSSFSTIMNERHPQDRYMIDLMLAHINRNNVEAAYNRALHLEKRREIAQEWADLIYPTDSAADTAS